MYDLPDALPKTEKGLIHTANNAVLPTVDPREQLEGGYGHVFCHIYSTVQDVIVFM